MTSEQRNRTNKAQAIAAALVVIGVTADDTLWLPESTWAAAAVAGWHIASAEGVEGIAAQPWTTASKSTRTQVRAFLAADGARRAEDAEGLTAHATDDVFASIAAGSALPRPAQDPDGPVRTFVGLPAESLHGVTDLLGDLEASVTRHPAARHTLNCLATGGGRTGCAC